MNLTHKPFCDETAIFIGGLGPTPTVKSFAVYWEVDGWEEEVAILRTQVVSNHTNMIQNSVLTYLLEPFPPADPEPVISSHLNLNKHTNTFTPHLTLRERFNTICTQLTKQNIYTIYTLSPLPPHHFK